MTASTPEKRARKRREREMTSDGGRILIDYETASARLVDGETIHCFMNPNAVMLIGADWERDAVLTALREADEIHETGPQAQAMSHGVACILKSTGDYAFFQTKPPSDPNAAPHADPTRHE